MFTTPSTSVDSDTVSLHDFEIDILEDFFLGESELDFVEFGDDIDFF